MTHISELGRLVDVPLRTAWLHEANHFTPWLAANLDRLGDEIGIPLEHVQSEAPVTSFAADILARNSVDGSLVLIENQLEESDHGHLGQIMTYLAGLEAQTVIWVAPSFRPAHRSAIRWLNQNTNDPFAFFAVVVRIVRIGDSAMAPIFEVVEAPNQWDRQLQQRARTVSDIGERGAFYQDFWAHLCQRHPTEKEFGPAKGLSSRWKPAKDGMFVAQYVSKDSVGVWIRGSRGVSNEATALQLEPFAQRLETELGASIGTTYPFISKLQIDGTDRANWDRMTDWLHEESNRYIAVLKQVMEGSN